MERKRDPCNEIGRVESVDAQRDDRIVTFCLRIGDLLVACYGPKVLNRHLRVGESVRVVGYWSGSGDQGDVCVESVTRGETR